MKFNGVHITVEGKDYEDEFFDRGFDTSASFSVSEFDPVLEECVEYFSEHVKKRSKSKIKQMGIHIFVHLELPI